MANKIVEERLEKLLAHLEEHDILPNEETAKRYVEMLRREAEALEERLNGG